MTSSPPASTSFDILCERPHDIDEIASVVAAAFVIADHSAPPTRMGGPPGEVDLLTWLRGDAGWLPEFSLIATSRDQIIGHVVATRAHVDGAPALGLGPLSVRPDRQREGVGGTLVRDLVLRAEAAGETLIALLGDPAYYGKFGFVPAREHGVESPDPAWGDYFQAQTLGTGDHPVGHFTYAEPFNRL